VVQVTECCRIAAGCDDSHPAACPGLGRCLGSPDSSFTRLVKGSGCRRREPSTEIRSSPQLRWSESGTSPEDANTCGTRGGLGHPDEPTLRLDVPRDAGDRPEPSERPSMPTHPRTTSAPVPSPGTAHAHLLSAATRLVIEQCGHSDDAAFDALIDDARRHHISVATAAENLLTRHLAPARGPGHRSRQSRSPRMIATSPATGSTGVPAPPHG
jgi:hypothetical protein